jgi:hypothetical protein
VRCARVSVAALCIAIALSAAAPDTAPAQSAYPAANGSSSIVPRSTGFVRADFAEANLSLQFLHESLDAGLGLGAWVGAAARAGQVDMFAEFDFNPGFEGGVLAFKSLGGGARSLDVIAFSMGYQSTQRKLAAFNADSTSVTLSEKTQRDVTASLSVNVALGGRVMTGLGGSLRREWSSPGVARSVEVCVETGSPGGIIIPLCESRYLVELADYWAGQLRADLLWAVARLGGARSQPHLAVMGSSSVDLGQDAAARWNISGGIGVAPLEYPGQVIVALLVGVYDVSDANDQGLDVGDRLVTRLVLGIPFDLLLN